MKETGIDLVIDKVVHRIGNLLYVYLTGDFAKGKDSQTIELIMIGSGIDCEYLSRKITQAEELVGRRVIYEIYDPKEAKTQLALLKPSDLLLLWSNGD